jgi:SAM-dependent methyltransferase
LGFEAVGIDASAPMVAVAGATDDGDYVLGRAEELPVSTGSMGLVTVSSAFHWFDQDRFITEAARALRPGGLLVLYDHGFVGHMPLNDEFGTWQKNTYLAQFPSPPRNTVAGVGSHRPGFGPIEKGSFTEMIPMLQEELVNYPQTQTNTLAAVESGVPTEAVSEWLTAETAAFFPNPHKREYFEWWGRFEVLERGL